MEEKDFLDLLETQYEDSTNQYELDYWTPLGNLIMESLELRAEKKLSQTELAKLMETRQSVISRFENMGRVPTYKFIAKMANAFNHKAGITLYGDFMAVVPYEKQELVTKSAKKLGVTTEELINTLLEKSLKDLESKDYYEDEMDFEESVGSITIFPNMKILKEEGSDKWYKTQVI